MPASLPYRRHLRPVGAVAALALGALGAAGCSDDDGFPYQYVQTGDTGDTTTDTTVADTGTDAPSVLDAGGDTTPGDTTGDASQEDAVTVELVGGVTVFEVRSSTVDELNTGGIGAGFAAPRAAVEPVATVGACVITPAEDAGALFGDGPSADAGELTAVVGETAYGLVLRDDGDGARYVADAAEDAIEFFEGGDTIRVTGSGGADVGAFMLTVEAPHEPVVSEPQWSGLDSHERERPLLIRWDGDATADSVVINLLPVTVFPEPGIAEGNAITCTASDTGEFEVSPEALAWLPEGSGIGGGSVALTVARLVNATAIIDGTEVTVNATASHTVVGAVP